jgi:hypothetical protein
MYRQKSSCIFFKPLFTTIIKSPDILFLLLEISAKIA